MVTNKGLSAAKKMARKLELEQKSLIKKRDKIILKLRINIAKQQALFAKHGAVLNKY